MKETKTNKLKCHACNNSSNSSSACEKCWKGKWFECWITIYIFCLCFPIQTLITYSCFMLMNEIARRHWNYFVDRFSYIFRFVWSLFYSILLLTTVFISLNISLSLINSWSCVRWNRTEHKNMRLSNLLFAFHRIRNKFSSCLWTVSIYLVKFVEIMEKYRILKLWSASGNSIKIHL